MAIAIAIGVVGLVVIVLGQWAKEKNDREYRQYWADQDARWRAEVEERREKRRRAEVEERRQAEAEKRRQAEAEKRQRAEAEPYLSLARTLYRKTTGRDYDPKLCSDSFHGDRLTDRLATLSTRRPQSDLLFHAYGRAFDYEASRGRLKTRDHSTLVHREASQPSHYSQRRYAVETCELVNAPLRLLLEDQPPPSDVLSLSGSEGFLVDWAELRRLGH